MRNPRPTDAPVRSGSGYHLALDNIRERLALAFGPAAGLDITETDEAYSVCLRFPAGSVEEIA